MRTRVLRRKSPSSAPVIQADRNAPGPLTCFNDRLANTPLTKRFARQLSTALETTSATCGRMLPPRSGRDPDGSGRGYADPARISSDRVPASRAASHFVVACASPASSRGGTPTRPRPFQIMCDAPRKCGRRPDTARLERHPRASADRFSLHPRFRDVLRDVVRDVPGDRARMRDAYECSTRQSVAYCSPPSWSRRSLGGWCRAGGLREAHRRRCLWAGPGHARPWRRDRPGDDAR